MWNRAYQIDEATFGVAVRRANDDPNGYVMAGQTEAFSGLDPAIYCMRVDPLGDPIWAFTYGRELGRRFVSKVEIKNCDTGYIVAGTVDSPFEGGRLGILLRIDDLGILQWMKFYRTAGVPFDDTEFKDVEQLAGGGFIVTGHSSTTLPLGGAFQVVSDTILMETDASGTPVWSNQYVNVEGDNSGESLTILPQGYAIVGNMFDKSLGGQSTSELFTTDGVGNLQWTKQIFNYADGGSIGFLPNGTLVDLPNGDLVYPGGGIDQNACLMRFDAAGNFVVGESYGFLSWQYGTSMVVEPAGAGYTFCGPSSTGTNHDYMVVRADAAFRTGCSVGPIAPIVETPVVTVQPIVYEIIDVITSNPRIPVELPLVWTEDLMCESSPCVDPQPIICNVNLLEVTLTWPPLPATVVDAQMWRNGSFLTTVTGTSFTDTSPPLGTVNYELRLFAASAVCPPAISTCVAHVGVSFPPLVGHVDVIAVPWKPVKDEPVICWADALTNKGRNPLILCQIDQIDPLIGTDVPGVKPVVWLSLGDFPEQHRVTQEEGQHLAQFLANGGSLYIEGGDVLFNSQSALNQLNGCVATSDGDILGLVPGLVGLDTGLGPNATQLSAPYSGTGRSVDHLAPNANGAALLFQSAGPAGQGTAVYYDASISGQGTHRMITSSTSFFGYDGDSDLLLDLYLDALSPTTAQPITFLRGDGNGDGQIDIGDAIQTLGFLFSGNLAGCHDAMDANDDGSADIGDPIYLLGFQFSGGQPPLAPWPNCGDDLTQDALDCQVQPTCP